LQTIGSPLSCSHHQCIDQLGDKLVPAAYAADGTIEAVTLAGHEGWLLGLQWHLEDFADTDPIQHGIFQAFHRRCQVGRESARSGEPPRNASFAIPPATTLDPRVQFTT
jgi:gamma-glutamyl-gamma-aminobutyrate hydrolase PuuD